MKNAAIIVFFSAVVSASGLDRLSCAASCVQKIALVDGCAQSDLACHCSKAGAIKQLQPCLESACGDAETLEEAKEAYTKACGSAGIVVRFSSEKKRRDSMEGMEAMDGTISSSASELAQGSGVAGTPLASSSSSMSFDEAMASMSGVEDSTSSAGSEHAGMDMKSSGSASSGASEYTALASLSTSHAGMDMSGTSSSAGSAHEIVDASNFNSASGHEGMAMGGAAYSASSVSISATRTTLAAAKPVKASSAVTTTAGARAALYTGAAASQDIGRGLLGLVAAIAVVAL